MSACLAIWHGGGGIHGIPKTNKNPSFLQDFDSQESVQHWGYGGGKHPGETRKEAGIL